MTITRIRRTHLDPDRGHLEQGGVERLDPAMEGAIANLGTWARKEKLREVIALLYQVHWRTSAWLAQHLNTNVTNLTDRNLGPMARDGTLERRFPDRPNHPEQASRTTQIQ